MKPVYFDLSVHDLDTARAFFENLFAWKFERFPMPYPYFRIQAGLADEPGINGGIGEAKDSPFSAGRPLTNLTIQVSDLEDLMAKIVALGGAVIEPKTPIPGIGWYATCAEPGGLTFGMIQPDPMAG